MSHLLQYLFAGITIGSIYAIIALGFTIIHSATEIINFAQGEFVMLGGMVAVALLSKFMLPMALVFVLAVCVVTLVGILFERFTIYPLKEASTFSMIIITIGVSIFLRGIAMMMWGKDALSLPPFSSNEPFTLLGASIVPQSLWIVGISLVMMAGLNAFFKYTLVGKAMRACAANKKGASLCGINPRKMVLYSFALSAAMGAAAGIVIAPVALTSYDVGVMLGLKGFSAAIIGGLNSVTGAIAGGFILGISESFGAGLVSSQYKDAIALFVLLGILFLKPSGIMGRRSDR